MTRTTARSTLALCFLAPFLAAACGRSEPPAEQPAAAAHDPATHVAPLTAGWMATDGIETPESVYVDQASGFIFSSQIAGAPDGRDGNGRIVKLGGDGQVVSSTWVTGLNAPKGLRSHNGTLWTADLDEVIGIDIVSGTIASRTKIDGALFLNDVATGADGTVYVSDMMANRIYAVRDGQAAVFAEGEQLEWPNGLLVDGNRLIVGGWGRPKPDFSTDVPGRLFALDLQTKQKTPITPKPFANIDGVESDGRGGYIVSDYLAGKVMQVSAAGEVRELRQFKPGAADIGFVPAGNVLLVPHMNENTVAAYDLSNVLR
ncbi:MAG: ATP/GTP-binding protein [Acidobacteria bacterium]|nr:ATP/GTP-binding protein [Acidobacteriota bacterium]